MTEEEEFPKASRPRVAQHDEPLHRLIECLAGLLGAVGFGDGRRLRAGAGGDLGIEARAHHGAVVGDEGLYHLLEALSVRRGQKPQLVADGIASQQFGTGLEPKQGKFLLQTVDLPRFERAEDEVRCGRRQGLG